MTSAPRISVVMPVYNGGRYLTEAIDSVLAQSFEDFELIVLDDGSTDDSAEIAQRYAAREPRLSLHRLPHRGLVATLNHGLELARGDYIARADADDLNHRHRFARQCSYMDRHPDVGICGSSMRVIGGYEWRVSLDPEQLRCQLLFGMPMSHGSAVFRRAWLSASGLRYDSEFSHAEDFDLLERAAQLTKLGNVPEILYEYRFHATQVSRVHGGVQSERSGSVRARQLARLGMRASAEDLDLLRQFGERALSTSPAVAVEWMKRLIAANERTRIYRPEALRRVLAERLYGAVAGSPSLRPWAAWTFRNSGIDEGVCRSAGRALRLVARSSLPLATARRLARVPGRIATFRTPGPTTPIRAVRHLWRRGELDVREFYVFHDRCAVFLVVSKVACTSMKTAIASAYDLRVPDADSIHDVDLWRRRIPSFEHAIGRCPDSCRDYFKFAFVRNPLDRLVSCYEDQVAGRPRWRPAFPGYPFVPARISFGGFVDIVARIPDTLSDRHFRGQHSSIFRDGRAEVDFVGRFENLDADWEKVAEACRFPAELPRLKASPSRRRNYRDYYSARSLDAVRRRYHTDFSEFGYEREYAELLARLGESG